MKADGALLAPWMEDCLRNRELCRNPKGTKEEISEEIFKIGECNKLPFDLSDCYEVCTRNNTQPGATFGDCKPLEDWNPLIVCIILLLCLLVTGVMLLIKIFRIIGC